MRLRTQLMRFAMAVVLLSGNCIPFNREWAIENNKSWLSLHTFSQGLILLVHDPEDDDGA